MSYSPLTVLLVEDDEIDVEAIRRSFKKLKIANPIKNAKDGVEALGILRGIDGYEKICPPYIILLDINMPRMNGLELLEIIRSDEELKDSVVFVLTTSDEEKDRFAAYQNNVAGYILKHKSGESFIDAVSMLEHYWKVVELPKKSIGVEYND